MIKIWRTLLLIGLTLSLTACQLIQLSPPTFVPPSGLSTTTPTPAENEQTSTPFPTSSGPAASTTPFPTMTPSATPGVNTGPVLYYTQAGDTLPVVAAHFSVSPESITSPDELPKEAFLPPGQVLVIPQGLVNTTSKEHLLPDSELVYSPSASNFDVEAYVQEAGGYLSEYQEYLSSLGQASGGEIVAYIAENNSINPRLLLALLEYQSGWVFGGPQSLVRKKYPLGHLDYQDDGLLAQLRWAVNQLSIGYYGWREGRLTDIILTNPQNPQDQLVARIAPDLNAGTVALQYYFSQVYSSDEWLQALHSGSGFSALYEEMFGDPWVRAQNVEPLFPPDLKQPELQLPFLRGPYWSYTGGPHGAWEREGSWAAIDFAPVAVNNGCEVSRAWVTAAAPGTIVRSEHGVVTIDLDGDGNEQTGWVLLYLHVSGRVVEPGDEVEAGDLLGHPSCEGGIATGVHIHFARKYNGEWIAAHGPVPLVLSGWTVQRGQKAYEGRLVKDGKIIEASQVGAPQSSIRLEVVIDDENS